jgi:hypothetical protein
MSPQADPEPTEAADSKNESKTEFEQAGDEKPLSLVQEFGMFIIENKAWWMVPIVAVLGLVGLLVLLGTTGAAPFIYTLF